MSDDGRTREQRAAYMRAYRARNPRYRAKPVTAALELAASPTAPTEPPEPRVPGRVESEIAAELALLGAVRDRMPGTCATALALGAMMDADGERSSAVAAQLRLILMDLRTAAAGASGTGRLAALRGDVSSMKRGG